MIAAINGVLVSKSAAGVIIEAGGIGYQLIMPTPDLGALPGVGETARAFVYLQIKDDAICLYGFSTEAKKELFIKLISVSGVGPKVAMGILSHLSPEELEGAIATEDIALISNTPGIGKKTAQRLVLELKEKVCLPGGVTAVDSSSTLSQAREALVGLGYAPEEAAAALSGAEPEKDVDWYLKFALKKLARV